jgi:hypothetical protein
MAKRGRPKTLNEKMTTMRVRESQRVLLNAMRKENEPHHKILSRLLTFYFDHKPKLKKRVKRALLKS